jgi:hypothetical protein
LLVDIIFVIEALILSIKDPIINLEEEEQNNRLFVNQLSKKMLYWNLFILVSI